MCAYEIINKAVGTEKFPNAGRKISQRKTGKNTAVDLRSMTTEQGHRYYVSVVTVNDEGELQSIMRTFFHDIMSATDAYSGIK